MNKSYYDMAMKEGYDLDQIIPIDLSTYQEILAQIANEPPTEHRSTGLFEIDSIIKGFEPSRLYVLSAQTKAGKTTMAQTFMHNLGKQKIPSMIFSYEMNYREVAKVFGEMDKTDGVKTDMPVYVPRELHRGGGELQYQWLFESILKAKEEKGVEFVVIDHLHFLLPLRDYRNTSMIIGGIVREIKRIANALQVSIMLIAHTQKIPDDKVPDWTMIRDSSFITQEADMVMMMYRIKSKEAAKKQTDESTENVYTNKTILSVELNRMGGTTGKVKMKHNSAKFVPWTEEDEFMHSQGLIEALANQKKYA